jgi:hypothetical protein
MMIILWVFFKIIVSDNMIKPFVWPEIHLFLHVGGIEYQGKPFLNSYTKASHVLYIKFRGSFPGSKHPILLF